MRPSTYLALRRVVQCATIVLFCLLPFLNAKGLHQISGSLFALQVYGLPFADPAAAMQALLAGAAPADLWVGAVFSLLLAFVFGRVFCSWICPYGFFSESVFALLGRKQSTGVGAKQGRAFILRLLVTAAALLCSAFFAYPLLTLLSMPGEISLTPLLLVYGSWTLLAGALALPMAVLALEALSGRRLWCRYVCPQSVFLGIAARVLPARLPGLRLTRRAAACSCKRESPCAAACSLALEPRRPGGAPRMHCTLCGDCLTACAAHGSALQFRLGKEDKSS